jgi:hypothetical protein
MNSTLEDQVKKVTNAMEFIPADDASELRDDLLTVLTSPSPREDAIDVLRKHMFVAKEDWQYEMIGIVSDMPADEIKKLFQAAIKADEEDKKRIEESKQ